MSDLSDFAGGGAPKLWVSGTTYAFGKIVVSPTDYQTYRRIVAGAGTTDPASDATNWRPAGARAVKSIQRGVIALAAASTSNTATVSSVSTSKAELRHLGQSAYPDGGASSSDAVQQGHVRLSLTSATVITATRQNGYNATASVSWELVEYY